LEKVKNKIKINKELNLPGAKLFACLMGKVFVFIT
jgi:hypothetical protein